MDVERPTGLPPHAAVSARAEVTARPVDQTVDRSAEDPIEERAIASVEQRVDRSVEQPVVRSFIRNGQIVSMPANQSKRLVLMRWLCDQCFARERAYTEREVNERLAAYHEDFAMLRRYLIDAGLLTRSTSGNEYRKGPA